MAHRPNMCGYSFLLSSLTPSRPFTAQLCNVQVVTAESEAPGRHGGFDDYTERTIDLYWTISSSFFLDSSAAPTPPLPP